MKSTFQTIKKRILPQSGAENSKSDKSKRKIVHPHLQDGEKEDAGALNNSLGNIAANKSANVSPAKSKRRSFSWIRRKNRKKLYETKDTIEHCETVTENKTAKSEDLNNDDKTTKKRKPNGFFRRSLYSPRYSPDDTEQKPFLRHKDRKGRSKSVYGTQTSTSTLSVLSLVRRSIYRRSKQNYDDVPIITIETESRDVTSTRDDFLGETVSLQPSIGDIANTKSDENLEAEGAKAMSFGSDVDKSTGQLKTSEANLDLNLDMNDITVNVCRLDNRAAYDKIALRPKRRTARKARGATQQHVIKVQAGNVINGFSDSIDEDVIDGAKDIAPPQAKKPRPPSLFPPITDESEKIATTPKRHSMGRSPMGGPGPGMMVPSLADVQKVKLRKRQTDEEVKPQDKALPKVKVETKSTEKSKTSKTQDDATKKAAKRERKISSEGPSSIFPWKNKSTPKSPQPTRSDKKDEVKENSKPKVTSSMFPALKPVKKNSTEKEPKLNTSSEDKKEATPKKKTFGLGKRDKNRSGNNSKTTEVEPPSETSSEVQKDQEKGKSSSIEKERGDNKKEKGFSSLEKAKYSSFENESENDKKDDSKEGSKTQVPAGDDKVETKKNRYSDKLKLEAAKLAENRVAVEEGPSSPKSTTEDAMKPPIAPKSPTKIVNTGVAIKITEKEEIKSVQQTSPIEAQKPSSPIKKNAESTSPVEKLSKEKPLSPSKEKSSFRFLHDEGVATPKNKTVKSSSQEKENLKISTEKRDEKDSKPVADACQDKRKDENVKVKEKKMHSHSPDADKISDLSKEGDGKLKTVAVTPDENKPVKSKIESPVEANNAALKVSATVTKAEEKKTVKTPTDVVHKPETKPTSKTNNTDQPSGGLYSRSMLKPVSGNKTSNTTKFSERKIASFKEISPSSPSRALRTRSFNVGSVTSSTDKPVTTKSETIEEVATKKRSFSQPPNPSPANEKPKLATKPPITPNKTLVINEKATIQDAENNNVEKKDKTAEIEKPVARRRNAKSETNADDKDVPDWVKVARRRSKVWDDGKKSNSTVTRQISAGSEKPKDADRPKTLAVVSSKPPRTTSGDAKTVTKTPTSVTKTPTSVIKTPSKATKTPANAPKTHPSVTKTPTSVTKIPTSATETNLISRKTAMFQTNTPTSNTEKKAVAPTNAAKTVSSERVENLVISEKSPSDDTSTKSQVNRMASIPKIDQIPPRKVNASKLTTTGQPAWLAIAMQKQKSWSKEETV